MKLTKMTILGLTLTFLFSCASQHHGSMRGSVVMKTGPDSGHVCMGKDEVKAGDKVNAYRHNCRNSQQGYTTRGNLNVACTKEKIGQGTVLATLNDHYSEVRFDKDVPFVEGTIVEKE